MGVYRICIYDSMIDTHLVYTDDVVMSDTSKIRWGGQDDAEYSEDWL